MTSRTPSFVRRFQIALFFALAYALTWAVWGMIIAEQHGLIGFHLPQGFFAYFSLTLAALLVAGLAEGRAALAALWRGVIRWRVAPRWYAAALLVPIGMALATAGLNRLFGGAPTVGVDLTLGAALGYFAVFFPKVVVTEELAWRGYALPRLAARYGALWASLLLGLLWGVWHTPLFFIAGSSQAAWPYVGFVLLALPTSVLHTWVYDRTGGSILLAGLLHAAFDAAFAYCGLVSGGPRFFWLALVVVTAVAAVVVVAGRWNVCAPAESPVAIPGVPRR